jgi:hypothetical protein
MKKISKISKPKIKAKKLKKIDWSSPSMIDIYYECSIQYFDHISLQIWNGDEWKEIDSEHKNGGWFFQDYLFEEYFGPFKTRNECEKRFCEYYKGMGYDI